MNDNFFQNKAFQSIEPEKMRLIEELSQKVRGKTTMEALDLMMFYLPKISEGRPLRAEEKTAIFEAAMANMNEKEKNQFHNMMRIVSAMGGNT